MGAVGVFSGELKNVGLTRLQDLTERGVISDLYVKLEPRDAPALRNASALDQYREVSPTLWAWTVGSGDWRKDADEVLRCRAEHGIDRFMLNYEVAYYGKKLREFFDYLQTHAPGLIFRFSAAGVSPSWAPYDYRELDRRGIEVSWQCYDDSGEGQNAQFVVQDAHRSMFVLPDEEYRHWLKDPRDSRAKARYGWGKVYGVLPDKHIARFDSYLRPNVASGAADADFVIDHRRKQNGAIEPWGVIPRTGELTRNGVLVGLLMGRIAYPKFRATLDVTRGFATKHSLLEWSVRADVRVAGSVKRPVDVYMIENCSNSVLEAIARGAG